MAKRQKQWARKATIQLRMILGNKCAWCGRHEEIQFDCIVPQGDTHHRFDSERRICFYRRQHEANNVQLLCEDCHIIKSKGERTPSFTTAAKRRLAKDPF